MFLFHSFWSSGRKCTRSLYHTDSTHEHFSVHNWYQMAYTLFVVKLYITFTNFIFHNTYFLNKKNVHIFYVGRHWPRTLAANFNLNFQQSHRVLVLFSRFVFAHSFSSFIQLARFNSLLFRVLICKHGVF